MSKKSRANRVETPTQEQDVEQTTSATDEATPETNGEAKPAKTPGNHKVYDTLEDCKAAEHAPPQRIFVVTTPNGVKYIWGQWTHEAVQYAAIADGYSARVAEGKTRLSAEAVIASMTDAQLAALGLVRAK